MTGGLALVVQKKKDKRPSGSVKVEAKDDGMKSSMLKALMEISTARERFVSGKASSKELTQVVDSSTKVAVQCTNHIIQLFTEVLTISVPRRLVIIHAASGYCFQ